MSRHVCTDMQDRVVVITGATAGVGRAAARAFARAGARVALLARGLDGLQATGSEIRAIGRPVLALQTDVADADQVEHAASAVERELGPIDVWINNATATVFAPFGQITAAEYRRATEVTYLGQVNGTRAALSRMRAHGRGHIIQVGSALAYRAIPLQSPYCGAKHAVKGFTEALRCELLAERSPIDLSMIQLPAVNTPQFRWSLSRLPHQPRPVAPVYQPELAARAILWLAEHPQRELFLGAPTWVAILGTRIWPALFDWYLARTAISGQQDDVAADPQASANLWQPVPGDHGARGVFGREACARSPQFWLQRHGHWVALGVLAVAAAGLLMPSRPTRRSVRSMLARGGGKPRAWLS